jgi:hypothetical protein
MQMALRQDIKKYIVEEIVKRAVEWLVMAIVAVTLFLLPFLLKYVPTLKPFFSESVPLWVTFSVVFAIAGIALFLILNIRRSRRAALTKLNTDHDKALSDVRADAKALRSQNATLRGQVGELTRELERYKQPFYRFECLGLLWELDGVFLQVFRTDAVPHNVLAIVRGPLCPHCESVLAEPVGQELANMVPRGRASGLLLLVLPCKRCGHRPAKEVPTVGVDHLKVAVFKEAQRLARRGRVKFFV